MPAAAQLVAFLWQWHGLWRRREGATDLRRTLAQLQGLDMPVSDLEGAILPARLAGFSALQLDELLGAGELLWQGSQPLGRRDGLIVLYRAEDFPALGRIRAFAGGERARQLRELLLAEGALELERIIERLGGFPDDVQRALWQLAWHGEVTSDSLGPLRARQGATAKRFHGRSRPRYTTRRRLLPGAGGRWRLLSGPCAGFAPASRRRLAAARQLLDRQGIVWPAALPAEAAGIEDLVAALELLAARGQAQRCRLTAEAGEAFLAPGAGEVWRQAAPRAASGVLAACDPANPFGACLPWPAMAGGCKPRRSAGARVLFLEGECVGYLPLARQALYTPRALASPGPALALLQPAAGRPVFLESINGKAPYETPWHQELVRAGFSPSRRGYLLRPRR